MGYFRHDLEKTIAESAIVKYFYAVASNYFTIRLEKGVIL